MSRWSRPGKSQAAQLYYSAFLFAGLSRSWPQFQQYLSGIKELYISKNFLFPKIRLWQFWHFILFVTRLNTNTIGKLKKNKPPHKLIVKKKIPAIAIGNKKNLIPQKINLARMHLSPHSNLLSHPAINHII